MMMKLFTIPIRDKGKLIKSGNLSKKVIELVPISKDGFEKWGEGFAYHWLSYFHDEILRSLRSEISSGDELTRDTKSIEALALNSRRAQINIRQSLVKAGLPDTLINANDDAASSSVLNR